VRPARVKSAAYDAERGWLVVIDVSKERPLGEESYLAMGDAGADGGTDGNADGGDPAEEGAARTRLLLFDTRSGWAVEIAANLSGCLSAFTHLKLLARGDGTFVLVGTQGSGSATTAQRLSLTQGPTGGLVLAWTGRVSLTGQVMDDLIHSDRGVVVPLVHEGADVSVTLTDDAFASATECGL
jgi:hypothetical protein